MSIVLFTRSRSIYDALWLEPALVKLINYCDRYRPSSFLAVATGFVKMNLAPPALSHSLYRESGSGVLISYFYTPGLRLMQ